MVGMKRNLKQTLEIAETAAESKIKLQARAIAIDCYEYNMDLATNGIVVTDAIKNVNAKMDHLDRQEKEILQDIKEDKTQDEDIDQEKTNNGIF